MKNGVHIKYTKFPESAAVVNYVVTRFRKGLGTNIFVIGLSGTGKSSSSLRLGELITQEIHGEVKISNDNIADSLIKVLAFIQKVKKPGEVLIIEEASVLFPSVRAMANENLTIGKVFDTIRKKQIILISNAPLLNRIDGHMRSLANVLIETQKINKRYKVVISKCYKLQTNPQTGKTYFHKFVYKGSDVDMIYTRMPNKEIWNNYEGEKDKFMEELYEDLKVKTQFKIDKQRQEIQKIKAQLEPELKDIRLEGVFNYKDLHPNKQKVYDEVLIKGRKQIDVAEELGISNATVSAHFRWLEKNKIIKDTPPIVEITKEIQTNQIEAPLITT